MVGTWAFSDSTAKFRVRVAGGKVVIDGWSSGDDERFRILEIRVLADGLFFRALMPSTQWETANTLKVINRGTLSCRRDHAGEISEPTMTRSSEVAGPSKKPGPEPGVP